MLYETKFLISLFLTLIIEIPILFVFIKYIFKIKLDHFKIIFIGLLASVLTLPYLWFIFPNYINSKYYIYVGELLVIVIEGFIYNRLLNLNIKRSFLVSVIANATSFIFGLFFF